MAKICVSSQFSVSGTGELTINPGVLGIQQMLSYTAPGSFSFTKASYPGLARVLVRVQAAGGGSAGSTSALSQTIAREGGSGGGYSESIIQASSLGATETITVGAGGVAGAAANGNGGDGGGSSFGGFVIAAGGLGGQALMTSGTTLAGVPGRPGALAGTGQIAIGGGASGVATRFDAFNSFSGFGGQSHLGNGGFGRTNQGPGTVPNGYGGGAGGSNSAGGAAVGGAGGDGAVFVTLIF
jgi:hypothetical protein